MVHGDQDPTVPYSQSVALNAALTKARVPHELVTIPGGKHGSFSDEQTITAFDKIWEFSAQEHPVSCSHGAYTMNISEYPVSEVQGIQRHAESPFGLDAASRALLREQVGQSSPEEMSIEQARQQMRDGQAVTLDDPSLHVDTVTCGKSTIDIVRRSIAFAPVVFFCMVAAGSWEILRSTDIFLIAALAQRSRCAIAFSTIPWRRRSHIRKAETERYRLFMNCSHKAHASNWIRTALRSSATAPEETWRQA